MLKVPAYDDSPTSSIFDSFDCKSNSEGEIAITDKMSKYKKLAVSCNKMKENNEAKDLKKYKNHNEVEVHANNIILTQHSKMIKDKPVSEHRNNKKDPENAIDLKKTYRKLANKLTVDNNTLNDLEVNEKTNVSFRYQFIEK